MEQEDMKYINLISQEIIEHIDQFSKKTFQTERQKLIVISGILSKMNLFLNLLNIAVIDEEIIIDVGQIMSYNLSRLIEITGYSEQELDDAIKNLIATK